MEIDARSVVAVSGIAVAIALILSLLIARGRWRDRGFTWLVIGNAAFLISVTSIITRDLIGFELAALLAISGALFGIIFAYFAVLAFDDRPVPVVLFCAFGIVVVAGQGLIAGRIEDVAPLIFSSSLINGLLTAFMTAHVWRILRGYGVRVASIVSLPFAAISAGYAVRLCVVIVAPDSGAPLVATVLIVSVMALAAIILQIGFLALDESRARQVAGEALAAAQDAAKAKSRFLRAISHEIRTPLNGILGLSELMRSGALGPLPEPGADFAEEIHSSGASLLDMFDALINLSAMEAGGISLTEEPVDLGAVLTEVHAAFAAKAAARAVQLILSPNVDVQCGFKMKADRARLIRAVGALLDNAVKYTPEGGSITVSMRQTDEAAVEVAVQDSGPGIALNDIPVAVTLFGRVGGVDNPANGAGVGLALATEIARAHGGRLNLEVPKGSGLRAVIVLPGDRRMIDVRADFLSMIPERAKGRKNRLLPGAPSPVLT